MSLIADAQAVEHRPVGPGEPGYDPFHDLWARLSRPFDVIRTMAALTGLSHAVTAQIVGVALASSEEAQALLDGFPKLARGLVSALGSRTERCKGELRGPVLWSETMSARASSFGDPDLYICATPSRAYDVDENRVLVAALLAIRDGARDATENLPDRHLEDPLLREVKRNGNDARRYLEHPTLQKVTRARPNPRELKRTRKGRKARVYAPAVAVLERAANPIDADQVRGWCDRRTLAQISALMGLVTRLEARSGRRLPEFRVEHGSLYAGPLQYLHPKLLGEQSGASGILLGPLLIDVPDVLGDPSAERAERRLTGRAEGRPVRVVRTDDDLDGAVSEAVQLVRRGA